MLTQYLVVLITFVVMIIYHIDGQQTECLNRERSPLCFCRSMHRRNLSVDWFISKISLFQCSASSATRQCGQGRLYPSSINITQIVPNIVNYNRCLESTPCLHTLRYTQFCQNCQIMLPSLLSENTSYTISTNMNDLPSDSCFYICENDKSCGFLCFDRRVQIKVNCNQCQRRQRNVTCRCLRVKQKQSCSRPNIQTTTARWMQKRGFPAAAILALLVLLMILVVLTMKFIRRQLDGLARRNSIANRRSITTITTSYRSGHPSPATIISFANTPLVPRGQIQKELVTTNTLAELLYEKPHEYPIDIHRHKHPDKLSNYLLQKTSNINSQPKEIIQNVLQEDQL